MLHGFRRHVEMESTWCRSLAALHSLPSDAMLDNGLSTNLIHYLPVTTTVVAAAFFRVLWRHRQRNPFARYVMWWMIGVGLYGLGTLTEALTSIIGWNEPIFRTHNVKMHLF